MMAGKRFRKWGGARRFKRGGGDNRAMFAPLHNDTFLRACLRQPTTHTPSG
jgi:hypothetical protein